MARSINVGVDFRSLGLRAAYVTGGEAVCVLPDEQKTWLLCEQQETSSIGIAFPSIKSKIGMSANIAMGGETRAPEDVVAEELRALRSRIEAHSSQRAGQAVISVPAGYSASRRAALRDAALKAGYADAHLLNDSMAAVMAYAGQSNQSATLLVYSIGYSGFEVGLVRAARGRYRALGYEAGDAPGGAFWDQLILKAWIEWLFTFISERNLFLKPHPQEWRDSLWMSLRLASQQVKEALSAADNVPFPVSVPVVDEQRLLSVGFSRSSFEGAIAPSIQATLDLAEKVLDEASLSSKDVDVVLLVGGSSNIPLIPALLEKRLGKKPVALEADALARGAALYATRLETRSLPATPLGEEAEGPAEAAQIPAAEPAIAATVTAMKAESAQFLKEAVLTAVPLQHQRIAAPAVKRDVELPLKEAMIQHARGLAERGEHSQAEDFLKGIIKDAQNMLDLIRSGPSPAVNRNAERAIAKAYRLLREGKFGEAVPQSHLAWQLAPDSPEIFDKMIDVHCQAGMAKSSIEDYQEARKWLECAHSHDQSNTKIHQALAERHYIQAKQLAERGRRKEAIAAVEQCLFLNPEHEKGNELNESLRRR